MSINKPVIHPFYVVVNVCVVSGFVLLPAAFIGLVAMGIGNFVKFILGVF
jgi:hypothetical protein